jgi:hypothetical protein
MYLFLSTGRQFRKVDVLKTVEAAWKNRFHAAAPDLGDAGGNYGLYDTVLERTPSGLTLVVKVKHENTVGKIQNTYRFRIAEGDFKP